MPFAPLLVFTCVTICLVLSKPEPVIALPDASVIVFPAGIVNFPFVKFRVPEIVTFLLNVTSACRITFDAEIVVATAGKGAVVAL